MNNRVLTVENVLLARRGQHIVGQITISQHHMVFSFVQGKTREIWICYPIIERITKSRGLLDNDRAAVAGFDRYSASNIRLCCKDFTYYLFDFENDLLCSEVYSRLSGFISLPKVRCSPRLFYAFEYTPNMMENNLKLSGWDLYKYQSEYKRQGLDTEFWRETALNADYKMCASYPKSIVVPASISDSVLKYAAKFRSKLRIPAVVYKHHGENGNVIARCAQPLVGLNLQNRSIQDEKLVVEIFRSQDCERMLRLDEDSELRSQPQRNLIVDLRPITNAMAQHALGAGTENADNYRGKTEDEARGLVVEKIFCNIDNIHVMRDSLTKLVGILSDLDKFPIARDSPSPYPLLQQSLMKTQWLNRLSLILQLVDRITKSIHLNNTNVLIHCSDGWDRTSQVSALLQLCLDPYFRTTEGFMVLVEKEWVSFGFKFATRGDHSGCVGALVPSAPDLETPSPLSTSPSSSMLKNGNSARTAVSSFFQRAATHIKNTPGDQKEPYSTYPGSSERLPIFHQFLDCVYQIMRQHPTSFEFNSRFLKRLFYHHHSCQYGTFLCDLESEMQKHDIRKLTVSVWDYFRLRPQEFTNAAYVPGDVLFVNYSGVKWWFELYGRSDEEMNGLSNSLDKKFAHLLGDRAPEAEGGDTGI